MPGPERDCGSKGSGCWSAQPQTDKTRGLVRAGLRQRGSAYHGERWRSGGVRSSNKALDALVRTTNAELAATGGGPLLVVGGVAFRARSWSERLRVRHETSTMLTCSVGTCDSRQKCHADL